MMARRKKAAEGFHKQKIAKAAGKLFVKNGIDKTTMEDIANESGYGKATLYVYFKNKDEIVSTLALDSMKILLEKIKLAVNENDTVETQYMNICNEIVQFQKVFPYYFSIAVSKIGVDTENTDDTATYSVGEQINKIIAQMIIRGIKEGELRRDLQVPQTIYTFWASIYGIITMTDNKINYINKCMGLDPTELMNYSFGLLYKSIREC
ncbi:TetR/AcrR family transcriptional regulator [Inconstantimicrobium porci]|uniref:TetR/AcrR family transcriptional regulator n=2 Tax=Inconstantimicrobium porci TaxID=2652291 RepID=A0A7X2T0W7_9CLOT|nr:TetR/AcrR family transcriptional regulator [Inconstantimicrobium porci]MSR90989.1 TetR/AcrR family transcriptional regulator [Inconstantimicrobium porci]